MLPDTTYKYLNTEIVRCSADPSFAEIVSTSVGTVIWLLVSCVSIFERLNFAVVVKALSCHQDQRRACAARCL